MSNSRISGYERYEKVVFFLAKTNKQTKPHHIDEVIPKDLKMKVSETPRLREKELWLHRKLREAESLGGIPGTIESREQTVCAQEAGWPSAQCPEGC